MIENRMVVDSQWKTLEKQREAVCECDGCGEDIYEGEEMITFHDGHGNQYRIHDNKQCTYEYVANIGMFETA